jgi:membrane-associated protease RseP (regulator of RpoE activity)
MFGESSFLDLRWRIFGISFCIKLSFWVVWLLLGFYILGMSWRQLLLWMGVVLVSDLVHEVGHAIVGRSFGARISIVIAGFGGGLSGFEGLKRWQRILFFAAGPIVSFALWGAAEAYHYRGHPDAWGPDAADWIRRAVQHVRFLNLFIAVINILPIFPLDGGMILSDVSQAVSRRYGLVFALLVSVLCAGGLVAYMATFYWQAIRQGGRANIFIILLFAFAIMNAVQGLSLLIGAIRASAAPTKQQEAHDEPTKPAAREDDIDTYRPFDGGRYDEQQKR